MVTHAFFKALMFLGSGSVILGMAHEQDMRRYGNLRKYMPITAGTFIVGWLAIAGVIPFAGFWSKDEILAGAFGKGGVQGYALWAIGLVTALLTAFYMTRQVIMTFFGEEKWRHAETASDHSVDGDLATAADHHDDAHDDHAHHLTPDHTPVESPWTMTLPLIVLAGLSLVGGALNLPFSASTKFLERWLEPVIGSHELGVEGMTLIGLAAVATVLAALGILMAVAVYSKHRMPTSQIERKEFAHGWYIDEAYAALVGGPGRRLFDAITAFDTVVVDGAVRGIGGAVASASAGLSRLQTGRVRASAVGLATGAVAVIVYAIVRMSS
jgi:NADH-quinone oxidoreductase subunit L